MQVKEAAMMKAKGSEKKRSEKGNTVVIQRILIVEPGG